MDVLHMKLTEAGNPIPDSMYLNFFIYSLPEEFNVLISCKIYLLRTDPHGNPIWNWNVAGCYAMIIRGQ